MMGSNQNDAAWTCICDHNIIQHGQGKNDAVNCGECDCPDFCTEKMATEVTQSIYEWALEDGEPWATTAHNYRRYRQGEKG